MVIIGRRSAVGLLYCLYKSLYPRCVFYAFLQAFCSHCFYSGTDIYRKVWCAGAHGVYAFPNVAGMQPATQHQGSVCVLLNAVPVKRSATTTITGYMCVQQDSICMGVGSGKLYQIPCRCAVRLCVLSDSIRYVRYACGTDVTVPEGFAECGGFVTVKLYDSTGHGCYGSPNGVTLCIDKQQHRCDKGWQLFCQLLRLCQCDRTRAGRVEYKADGMYARLCRSLYVFCTCQSADFDGGVAGMGVLV